MRGGFWAVLALLAAAVASGCSGSAGPSSAGRTVAIVPWIGQPAPPYNPPAPRVVPYATAAPVGRAGQLGVRQERMGVGLGNVLERFAFLNLGERPCLLRGFPKVTGVTTTRVRRPVPARRSSAGTYFGHLVPADIAPGERGFLDFATTDVCRNPRGSSKRYRALVFVLRRRRPPRARFLAGSDVWLPEDEPSRPPRSGSHGADTQAGNPRHPDRERGHAGCSPRGNGVALRRHACQSHRGRRIVDALPALQRGDVHG
jgi:hypothetical protein